LDEADIFEVARQIHGPEARQAYLHQACANNSDLQERIEALLRVHDEEYTFLETPAWPAGSVSEVPGTQIGPYKLVEKIGEGGFGVVFLAEQRQPMRRTVAKAKGACHLAAF
jgi:hypothetical protein